MENKSPGWRSRVLCYFRSQGSGLTRFARVLGAQGLDAFPGLELAGAPSAELGSAEGFVSASRAASSPLLARSGGVSRYGYPVRN